MKLLFDDSKSTQPRYRSKKNYLEAEHPLGNGVSAYLYLLPYGKDGCLVTTCFGNTFDFLVHDQPSSTKEAIMRYFPTATKLLLNKVNGKDHKTQLCQMEDPKDGLTKWFVCREAEDVDYDDYEDMLEDPDVADCIEKVLDKSMAIKQELDNFMAAMQAPAPMMAVPPPNQVVHYNNQQVMVQQAPQQRRDRLMSIIEKIVVSLIVGEIVTE